MQHGMIFYLITTFYFLYAIEQNICHFTKYYILADMP